MELRSPRDEIEDVQAMRECQKTGVRLIWLLDSEAQKVEYRSGQPMKMLDNPA
ncbi:MAG TPA: hypothetical protein V6D18_14720 [Thermosynechococcaceae cyanobacterium]